MKKVLLACLILIFCVSANAQENQETFAVVWQWTTGDRDKVNTNLATQATHLLDLWREGIVENVYLNTEAKFTDDEPMPNVVFFIKAKNKKDAKKTLNKMVFVKESIAQYELYPVGSLWLIKHEDFQKLHMDDQ
ncbi:MAG: hypothetical protein AAF462_04935 [Thermodesulfobacteriota bacterium]